MKNAGWMLVALALLLAGPVLAYDDEDYEPPKDDDEIRLYTGYRDSSTDDSEIRVLEYEAVESNPWGALLFRTSPYDDTQLSFMAYRLDSAEFGGELRLDLKRAMRVTATMDGLIHRLDHDPVANLKAVSDIKVVRSTDLEPNAEYAIKHRLYEIDARFHPPTMENFSFRGGVRRQEREGYRQSLHTGHCTACHTTAQGREVDQSTTDGTVGLNVRGRSWDLDYEILGRTFLEDGPQPIATFETPYRPATPGSAPNPDVLITPFNDRLWFPVPGTDPDTGAAAYDAIPGVKRTAHTLKFRTDVGRKDSLNLAVLQSSTENQNTFLKYEFAGFRGRYTWRASNKLRVNFTAQHDALDNDETFIDLPMLWGGGPYPTSYTVGGAATTLTFEEWRRIVDGNDALNFTDFTRLSSLDRSETRLGADAMWRAAKRGTFRAGLFYRMIDRDNVILADGTGETTSMTLKLGWNQRIAKKLRWNNSLVYRTVDNPYVNVDGALRAFAGFRPVPPDGDGNVVGNAPSPKSGASLQYYQLHELRVANVGYSPTDYLRVRSNVNWSPKGTWSLSGNARFSSAENDELDYSTWEQDSLGIGANFWLAASPEFFFTIGVDHAMQETDAIAVIPLMDG